MTALLWLSRFLLLVTLVASVLGYETSNDNSFFGARVSNEEAMKFFAELDKSPVQNAERRNYGSRRFRNFDQAVNFHTQKNLDELTDNLLSGAQFPFDASNSEGDTIAAKVGSHDYIMLPAMGLKLVGSTDEPIITMEFASGEEEKTFKNVKITLKGNLVFTKVPRYTMAAEIVKDFDSEEFVFEKFEMTDKANEILQSFQGGVERMNEIFGEMMDTTWLTTLQEQLGTATAYGGFTKDSTQLVIHLDESNALTQKLKAKSMDFLIAQAATGVRPTIAVFANFEDLIDIVRQIFPGGNAEVFTENVFLKELKTEACVFLVSEELEILETIKTNDHLQRCFGENGTNPLYDKIEGGIHAGVKVDFMDMISKSCYRAEEPHEDASHLKEEDTTVNVYGKVTKSGVDINLLVPVKIPTKIALHCFKGLMQTAPAALTAGQVEIKRVSRVKQDDGKTIRWTLSAHISLEDDYKTIPGTQIQLENLCFDAEGDEGDWKSWTVNANLATKFVDSDVNVAFTKEEDTYNLEVTSDNFILADLVNAFESEVTTDKGSQSLLSTLGVKDFSLKMTFGDGVPVHEYAVRGKPIIFGYDQLEISALISKENPNAKKAAKAAKAAKVKTVKRSRRSKKKKKGKRQAKKDKMLKKDAEPPPATNPSVSMTVGLYMNGADFTAVAKNLFGNEDISLEWLNGLKAFALFTTEPGKVKLAGEAKEEPEDEEAEEEEESSDEEKAKAVKEHNDLAAKAGANEITAVVTKRTSDKKLSKILPKAIRQRRQEEEEEEEEEMKELEFDDLDEDFAGKEIEYAITILVSWKVPSEKDECKSNSLCEWMVEKMPGTRLSIEGNIGGGIFRLIASITSQIKLVDNTKGDTVEELIFTGAALELVLGATVPSIELSTTMEYQNSAIGATGDNTLKFKGSLSASPGTATLSFSMDGYVYPVFDGVSYFGIGNLLLGGGITNGLPNFVFGASIRVGVMKVEGNTRDVSKAITIQGALGFDLGNPANNWIYGSIDALTVTRVCEAFDLDCANVPDNLKNAGFPNGITASYSKEVREVPGVGDIPAGVYIKGTISIFDIEANCELSAGEDGVELKIELSPLEWGNGRIQVFREEENEDEGPIAEAKFGKDFYFKIKGYANILNVIRAGINIEVSKTKFFFEIEGDLIPNLLTVTLSIEANYGSDGEGDGPLFGFTAVVQAGFGEKLKEYIKLYLTELQEKVTAVADAAKALVDSARRVVQSAETKVNGWKAQIQSWRDDLERKKQELNKKEEPPKCPLVCFQFMDWNSQCWKVWGHWVGCPWWNKCFKKIEDVFCLAKRAANAVINTFKKWAQQALLSIGQLLLAGVDALLNLAQKVLDLANAVLNQAEQTIEFIKNTINSALQMGADLLIKAIEAFEMSYLKLSATLGKDYSACVKYEFNVKFMEETYSGDGEACLDVKSFINAMIFGVTDGNSKTKGSNTASEKVKEVESQNKDVSDSNNNVQDKEREAENEIGDETKKKFEDPTKRDDIHHLRKLAKSIEHVPKRSTVPTAQEMEWKRLSEMDIPMYRPEDDPTMRGYINYAPLPAVHTPIGNDKVPIKDDTDKAGKRSLDFDSKIGPCTRMKRALQGYSDLTDGILKYSDAMQQSKSGFENSKLEKSTKLSDFQNMIEDQASLKNLTESDKEEVYEVYGDLESKVHEVSKRSNVAFISEDSSAMPIIRRQINSFLGKEANGKTFLEFTDLMHTNAVDGYKRSQIPNPTVVQGEKILGSIKAELQSIVTNEDATLTSLTPRLAGVKRSIASMTTASQQCRGN